ncbi:MAG: GAF domain-containing sensor histidine kinase [Chloroflexota bacterium]
MTQLDLPNQSTHVADAEQWLEAVVEVSRQIANLEALPVVLRSIVTLAMDLVSGDLAAVALLNGDRSELKVECFRARASYVDHPATCDTINSSIVMRAAREGRALCFPQDHTPDEATWDCDVLDQPIKAAAMMPLWLDGTSIGVLWVARHTADPFATADLNGLARLADQTVIALEHASMASRIQSIAITEERYRIAREMHDSLAQVLGYLNVQMQTLELHVRSGDCEKTLLELKAARRSIRLAQDDVRESILSLRTTLSNDLPLPTALEQYALEFGVHAGLNVYFQSDTPDPLMVTPLAVSEIVRIVQEALTNVRKHAGAQTVEINVAASVASLVITICDDGIGFDPRATILRHFGLSTMRERAQQIGGQFDVFSRPGAGTSIRLEVPLAPPY